MASHNVAMNYLARPRGCGAASRSRSGAPRRRRPRWARRWRRWGSCRCRQRGRARGRGRGRGWAQGRGGKFVGLGPGPERGATMATVPTLYAHPESVVLEEKMHQYPAEEIEHSVDDEFLRYFAPPRGSTKRTYPPHFATFAFINRLDTESKIA